MEAHPPFTATEWAAWLADSERRLSKVYRLSPGHLVAEYRREREITRGYHGREILELLQNAGDAARRAGEAGRVRLLITSSGMVMGNTGRPFEKGGVESLQTANLSPKREREAVVIGDKGLGFRSILNWTDSPLISSGELGIAFLPSYAAAVLRDLEDQCEELARRVAEERGIAGHLIVPQLAFPAWVADWATHPWPENDAVRDIPAACLALRREGFETTIGMPFATAEVHAEAVSQVDELQPEFLLLVDSISRLEIRVEGRAERVWCCARSGERWAILEGDRELSAWTVKSIDGEVPPELLKQEERTRNRFKLTVALPEPGYAEPGRLFCYFPTDTELPLPLLAHATVELDETRKRVNDTRVNRYILGVLAERIAELAEQRLEQAGDDSWSGCRLVTPNGAWGGELVRFGFPAALKEAAKSRKLVPVLGGGYRAPAEAKWVSSQETKWWPSRHFPEITAFERKEERKLAHDIGVEHLTSVEIIQRLLRADDLTPEERASVVVGLLESGDVPTGDELCALLCDEAGATLPVGSSAILQPTGELPEIPAWATIRFLHPELRRRLGQLLGTPDSRELQQKLRRFGVVEYSLAALIRPVLAEANRRLREFPETEPQIRYEVLQFLCGIYQKLSGGFPFPAEATLKLPSQTGDWVPPNQLYLGEGYGQEGSVTQDLYEAWARRKLLAGPGVLGLGEATAELMSFLQWLGVERWPRVEVVEHVAAEFLTEVKSGLRYPVEFGDSKFESPQALSKAWATDFQTVDGLPEILRHAAPEAVLAWMAFDSRSARWERAAPEHGKLRIFPPYKQYDRAYAGPVPSYVQWQMATTAWLPTAEGGNEAPRHCLIGDRQLESLFPQPGQPDAKLKNRYGIADRIAGCYARVGVMPGLAQIGRDELYRLLLEAAALSPDGKASRALARWFLLNEAGLYGFVGEHQKRFFREGQFWGMKVDQPGFFSLSELRHVDFEGLPSTLLRHLAIADLPKRIGAQKVKEILGITPLERSAVSQQLVAHRKSPSHQSWASWFEESKPAIKRLRQAQTKQAQALGVMDRLSLVLCDELQVQLNYQGVTDNHSAKEGEWFIFANTLYVQGDLEDSIDLLADAAGVAIASIFGIADGDAFSKVLRCEPRNRGKLLRRMCGDEFQSEIEAITNAQRPTYSGPIEPPIGLKVEGKEAAEVTSFEEEFSGGQEPVNEQEKGVPKQPGVKTLPHVPQPAKATRRLVVRNVHRREGIMIGPRKLVDGALCETMAIEFEAGNTPPRFALGIGHIMGKEAPGFDLASFDTAEDREAFRTSTNRDWDKVRRFIEVKGRSSSTARIELTGNELKAARKYGDRYFLYRIYQQGEGQFIVSILKNPMGAEEAQAQVFEIDLERAVATQRFEFVAEPAEAARP